ncbi:MAG: hypothetical protein HKN33_16285 [Pyrinomonadaceae bacterium]|nr:hypothetical protein [Pyrinomonadaceae bacterium]
MSISRELKKLRLFLFTPAPYLAGVLGIFVALAALSVSPEPPFEYLQAEGEAYWAEEQEIAFSFCYHCSGPNSLDVIGGVGESFIIVSTFPSRAVTQMIMDINVKANPRMSLERFNRTYLLLFGYLNFYVFLFAAFSVYSIHWEMDDKANAGNSGLNLF